MIWDLHFEFSPISEEWVISSNNVIWTSNGSTFKISPTFESKNILSIKPRQHYVYTFTECIFLWWFGCSLTWSVMTDTVLLFWSWCVINPESHWVLKSCRNTFTLRPFREPAPVAQQTNSSHWKLIVRLFIFIYKHRKYYLTWLTTFYSVTAHLKNNSKSGVLNFFPPLYSSLPLTKSFYPIK